MSRRKEEEEANKAYQLKVAEHELRQSEIRLFASTFAYVMTAMNTKYDERSVKSQPKKSEEMIATRDSKKLKTGSHK